MPIFPWIVLFLSCLLISASVFDWNFVFDSAWGKRYVHHLGRVGARRFVATIGLVGVVLSLLFTQ